MISTVTQFISQRINGKPPKLSDDQKDLLNDYCICAIESESENGLSGLSKHQRVVFHVFLFLNEVTNGGIEQYFYNYSGCYIRQCVVALREVGASAASKALTRGMSLFPNGKPHRDIDRRNEQLEKMTATNVGHLIGNRLGIVYTPI